MRLFIILSLLPFVANAQLTITTRGNYNNTANASTYAVTAFTPTANSLLVAMVAVTGSVTVATGTSMTGGSLTWVRQASLVNPTANGNSYHIFYAKVGETPVSTAVTYNCGGDAGTGAQVVVIQFTGYNRDFPIRQTKLSTAVTTSTNPTITFDTPLHTDNAYYIGWGGNANTVASTPPTGWTEYTDLGYNTPNYKFSTATRLGGVTTAGPFAFTNASIGWIVMGVEVDRYNPGLPMDFFE